MLDGPLDSLTEADVKRLVDEKVVERKVLEYKAQLPGHSDASKKEFLADVSSFANSAGGHILYGISEKNGVPARLDGLEGIDSDATVLRLEGIIRDGLDPRVPGIHTRSLPLVNANHIFVIRVPRSWAAPHMVKFQGSSRFYARSSNGKYQLDVREIRDAMLAGVAVTDRIRDLRLERLAKIAAAETPIRLADSGGRAVLHIVPVSTISQPGAIDTSALELQEIKPMHADGWSHRHNFDGFLTYASDGKGSAHSYVQIFRTGVVEAVDGGMLAGTHDQGLYIPSLLFERELIASVGRYLAFLTRLGVMGPYVVMLSLIAVAGFRMGVASRFMLERSQLIDRDSLLTEPLVVESPLSDPAAVLHPAFDAVWNAAGYPGSPNYMPDGSYDPRR